MRYPNLTIDTAGILKNKKTLESLCEANGISVSVVTKGTVGYEPIVRLMVENGAKSICEARIVNLIKFAEYYEENGIEKWLIRSPLLSEAEDTVRYSDVSLNTEACVIEALSAEAVKLGRMHKVVIMLELGELREGCMPDELLPLCSLCTVLPGVELYGIGTNLSCINDIVPGVENMTALADTAREVEEALSVKLQVVSGGGSSTLRLLEDGLMPKGINHLRLGEGIFIGNITCHNEPFRDALIDNFIINAEIIELKEKPSLPYGPRPRGLRAPADSGEFVDKGIRKRAIVALGKQDVHASDLTPLDPGIEILGDSSDCFIADVTDSLEDYKVGDVVKFRPNDSGRVSLMVSEHIPKILI